MYIFYVDLGIIALILILGLLLGGYALKELLAVLLGPIKILFIILFIISLLSVLYYFKNETKGGRVSKIIGAVLYAIGHMVRIGICLICAFCILYGFLLNWDNGGFHMLWAIFAIIGDFLVLGSFLGIAIMPDYLLTSTAISEAPAWVVGVIGLIWSVFSFAITQCILGFYDGVVTELFPKEFAEFLLKPFIVRIVELF